MNLRSMWDAFGADLLGSEEANESFTGEQLQNILVDLVEGYLVNYGAPGDELRWAMASYDQKMKWMEENFPSKDLYGW